MSNNKIDYLIKNDEKYLPWQFYNLFNYISIPARDKVPLIPHWNKKTKTVAAEYFNLNIGLLTGKINNITVLDIDLKDDGMKLWNLIKINYPTIITPTVQTPSGALHMYFKYNNKIKSMNRIKVNNKKIGWDIKSDNGIIIAPPSKDSKTQKKYKWVKNLSLNDIKPIKMPLWLEQFILSNQK
jgi:hypothetical protein